MRGLPFYFLLILTLLMISVSCNNSSPTETESTTEGTMTVKLNGADWSANTAVIGTYSNNVLTVTGQRNPGGTQSEQIQIVLYNISATGSYKLSLSPSTGRYTYGDSPTNIITYMTMDNDAGTINVTALDANGAKGTFSFKAKNMQDQNDVKDLTEGSFEVVF